MRRREFIAGLSAAAAWPLAAWAQQPTMPVIGFVHVGSAEAYAGELAAKGLAETGYVDGRNVTLLHNHSALLAIGTGCRFAFSHHNAG